MIRYQEIYQHNRANATIRGGRSWADTDSDFSRAQLTVFTTSVSAPEQSQSNLDWLLTQARRASVAIMVVEPSRVQFLGQGVARAMDQAFPDSWRQEYRQWCDREGWADPRYESSEEGECATIYLYRECVTVPKSQGVYEVESGRRMTRRRDIIQRFWNWGFPARRGRPLSVGQLRWTGNREELELSRRLFDQYYLRRDRSEIAKKICQAYTSTVRNYAWPDNW